MTSTQKQAVKILIDGGNIVHNGRFGIKVRDKDLNLVMKLKQPSFYNLAHRIAVLKKSKKRGWILSIGAVQKLHGNNLIKKLYNKKNKEYE